MDKEPISPPEAQPASTEDPFADLRKRRVREVVDKLRVFLEPPQKGDTAASTRPEVGIDQTIELASRQGRELINNFQPDQTGLRATELRIAVGRGELVIPMDKIFADPVMKKVVDENHINSLSSPVALLEMMVLFTRDRAAGQLLRRVTALANPQLGQSRQFETLMQQSLSDFSLGVIEATVGRTDLPPEFQGRILGSTFAILFGDLDLALPWDTARMNPVQKDSVSKLGRLRQALLSDPSKAGDRAVLETFLASDYLTSQKQHCAWARETAAKYPLAGNIDRRAREVLLPNELSSNLRETSRMLAFLDRQVNRIEDYRAPYDRARELAEIRKFGDFADIDQWVDSKEVQVFNIGIDVGRQGRLQREQERLEAQLASEQNPETLRRLRHRLVRGQITLQFMKKLQAKMGYINGSGSVTVKVGRYGEKETVRFRREYFKELTTVEETGNVTNIEADRIDLEDPGDSVLGLQRKFAAIRAELYKLRAFTPDAVQHFKDSLQEVLSEAEYLQTLLSDDSLVQAFNSESVLEYAADRFMSGIVVPELNRRKLFAEEEEI